MKNQLNQLKTHIKWDKYYSSNFNWNDFSKNFKSTQYSLEFVEQFKDKLNWYTISSNKNALTEKFIRHFKNYVYWDLISKSQTLSEKFIEQFKDKVDWSSISYYQIYRLSENFIRKYQHQVDWHGIFLSQKISPKFREEFKNK